MTSQEMRIITNENIERQNAIHNFIIKTKNEIKNAAVIGRSRCPWNTYGLPQDCADEVKKYFLSRGFIIKDPHEYCGSTLQVGEWLYW